MSLPPNYSRFWGSASVFVIVATLCVVFLLRECSRLPGRMASGVVDAARETAAMFHEALGVQPRISVDQTVYYEQIAPVAEFAVVTRDQVMRLSYSHQITLLDQPIPATTKHITVEAPFRIKAGFDLHDAFSVEIDPATGRITADLPPARILSVEPAGEWKYEDADGWFNHITAAERQNLLNDLQQRARSAAENSDLRGEAEKQARARLEDLARRNGREMAFRFRLSP